MDEIFYKFLNTYFFNSNKIDFKDNDLIFKDNINFWRLLDAYFILFSGTVQKSV